MPSCVREFIRTYPSAGNGEKIVSERLTCDLAHERRVPAALKLEVKSTRAGRAGHPMIRVLSVCATHARELRRIGMELVRD